jgi:hypothetical protein
MSGEMKKEFIPKERGSLPRVLLLDFDKKVSEKISEESKFQIFEGKTGMVDGERLFPRDSSEIEIIFLDIGKWDGKYITEDYGSPFKSYHVDPREISDLDTLKISKKDTKTFFSQVIMKGGCIVIFLGDTTHLADVLVNDFLCSKELNIYNLSLHKRYSTSIKLKPHSDEDFYYNFFNRFIADDDIKYYIDIVAINKKNIGLWYFKDEHDNGYAVVATGVKPGGTTGRLIISPKIKHLDKAVLSLLQDVFPVACDENIYPDLQSFKWLQGEVYVFPEVIEQDKRIEVLTKEYNVKLDKEKENLNSIKDKYSYLHEMLYKDDSDLFEEGKKLKDVVKKMFEEDLGFKDVKDMDKIRLKEGLALKEDLVLEGYMFTEIKGTEKGASPGWVDQLGKHVSQYCVATGTDIGKIKQIVVFNHERRRDPQERSEPFKNDPTFLASCKRDKIALIPVFELFKLAKDIKEKKITKETAKAKIVNCEGLFLK